MKKFIIAIIVTFFLPLHVLCGDDLIWNYKNDDFLSDIKNENPKNLKERQEKLDNEIKKQLDINLLPVNLEDCITIALKSSSTFKIAKSQNEEQKWLYANSLTFLIPELYYRYQIQDVRGEFLVGDILPYRIHANPVYSGVTFNYPILASPHDWFKTASQKNLFAASKHRVNYTREELVYRTATSYYELLESKLAIEVLIINLRERQEQYKLMRARHHIGVGTKFDVLRAESELAQAKQQLITALNSLRLKQANLADTIGIDITTTLYPVESIVEPIELVEKKYDIENLYKIALCLRQDIKAKQKEIRSLNYLRKMNYADFGPQINLTYEYARAGTMQLGSLRPNHTWSLNLVMPLGQKMGIGTMTKEKADAARLKTAELELRVLKGDVKQFILNSYYNSRSALEKIQSAQKEVEAADEGVRFAVVGFEVGTNNFLDVIAAQQAKTQARMTLISSTIEYNKAQVKLLFDTGIISPKTVLRKYETRSFMNLKYRFEE